VVALIAYRFYRAYLRQTAIKLAPGVHAVFGGGGNSLVVQDGKDVLLVDTKFPPASGWLRSWIARNIGSPVTKVVNTHYHYDHTLGNILYPDTQIIAHKNVPALMLAQDGDWWSRHRSGLPTMLIDDGSHRITVGNQEVILTHPDIAHTHGDLWVYLPEQNIIATGDIFLHTYYTFFDRGKSGTLLPRLIKTVRILADKYPKALFVPGHGPLAHAAALHRYADYLEFLYHAVEYAYKHGLSEDKAVRNIDLSQWKLRILPSFHHYQLSWATARNNIRWVYQIIGRVFR
jgi:cyclase